MIKLYNHPLSGNCHKVRLFLSILGLPFETELIDVPNGGHRTPEFGHINPLRQIPTIDDDGFVIQDSQAILVYLALKHAPGWFGRTPDRSGRVCEWLSFAAKEIAVTLQPARLYFLLGEEADIDTVQRQASRVLASLDRQLSVQPWIAGRRPTIADLACFPYVGLAHQGGLTLERYPAVCSWIARITALEGYISMPGLP